MTTARLGTVLSHLHMLARGSDLSDSELVERYFNGHDEAAFATLVKRFGNMVWGVCRHVLSCEQDAEDAFQATFLILARKASSIRKADALGGWLHGVAYRSAMKAKTQAARRRAHEKQAAPLPRPKADSETAWRELQAMLDEELQRLPDHYRAPFVLCCLEGNSKAEAARRLGWKEGTVSSRLARARKRLQDRLMSRGVSLSAVLCGAALTHSAASGAVPTALVSCTLGIVQVGASQATAGLINTEVAAIVKGVTKTMFLAKCRTATALLLGVSLLAGGAGALTHRILAAQPPAAEHQAGAKPADEKTQAKTARFGDQLPPGALARLGWDALRLGRFRCALTPDGKRVVTLSDGAVVHIFDATTGRLLERRLLGDRRDLCTDTWNFSLSANGSVAVVEEPTSNPRLTAWTVATGRQLLRLGPVSSHALSPNGRLLAAVEFAADQRENILRVYDLETSKPRNVASSGFLSHLRFTPDGKRLLGHAGGQADEIVCYDVADAKRLWAVSPGATGIGVTPDSRIVFLAKTGAKESFRAIDLETGKPAKALMLPTCEADGEPALAGDRLLLAPLRTGKVVVWDYRVGKELHRLRATPRDFLSVRAYAAADGKTGAFPFLFWVLLANMIPWQLLMDL
jgi:RNA polymerase sigma factor (sigma-70 family)